MMNKHFTYEWIGSDFIATFHGDISFSDIAEANGIICGDPRFEEMKYQIFDYSKINSIDLDHDVALIISNLDSAAAVWNHSVKVATVTMDADLKEKIEEYNKLMESSSWVTKTFTNKQEAIQWCTEE